MSSFVTSLFGAEDPTQSISWILPEQAEYVYGGLASLIIFGALWKFAGPPIKKAMSDRTARIQKELDASSGARSSAEEEAARIRGALGDIAAERTRILAEADVQAATLLSEGRVRIELEMRELQAKAEADIAAATSRSSDELRAEIARLSSVAAERAVSSALDDQTKQGLIEDFISRVGAS
jgi:F-type H+-transporting ATPase subunit b